MNLPDYIRQIGTGRFAQQFGIKERTAVAYQYGQRRPRRELAAKIVQQTPVTWDGIYGLSESINSNN